MLAKPYLQVAAVAGLTGVLVLAQPLAPSPTSPATLTTQQVVQNMVAMRLAFRGEICLNPNDFGIERIEGKLPHAPSFGVTHPIFVYLAQKIGDFWLPATNRTHAHIRLFGEAELEIRYHDFHLTSNAPVYCRDSGVMQ